MKRAMAQWILLLVLGPVSALASTFVGNGGNSGDVELLVTKQILAQSLALVQSSKNIERLCDCRTGFKASSICTSLNELSREQKRFCGQVLAENAPQLLRLIENEQIRYSWTHQPMSVQDQGRPIGVEAVTNRSENRITINQGQFLRLAQSHRVFLLGHEAFHLSDWNSKPLVDEGSIGPFSGPQGGRKLLNSLAAALVMQADEHGTFRAYRPVLNRPQGWKTHWLRVSLGKARLSNEADSQLANSSFGTAELSYEYFWNQFGLSVSNQSGTESRRLLSQIEVDESVVQWRLGGSYRYFPVDDPLSYWGQAHLRLRAGAYWARSEYRISDGSVSTGDETTSLGPWLDCNYFLPVGKNFWLFAGGELSYLNYGYDAVEIDYQSLQSAYSMGVSYAF